MQEYQILRIQQAKQKARTGTFTIASELCGSSPAYIPYSSVIKVSDGAYWNLEIVKRIESVNRLKDGTFYERLVYAKQLKAQRNASKSISNRIMRTNRK